MDKMEAKKILADIVRHENGIPICKCIWGEMTGEELCRLSEKRESEVICVEFFDGGKKITTYSPRRTGKYKGEKV